MHSFLTCQPLAFNKPVCRLGLASRGDSALAPDDLLYALSRGINFWNWPGASEGPSEVDAFSQAVRGLGQQRDSVVLCVQFAARTAKDAASELRSLLATLKSDYIDVLTLYYVEELWEWESLIAAGVALEYCREAQADGVIRQIGITSHQRRLAATCARSGLLDVLMIRYNAAHRGAAKDVFPVTDALRMPVIAYTALRWGALLKPTPDDPPGFVVPSAPSWYRFVLQSASIAVTLAAPQNRSELAEALAVLQATERLPTVEYEQLAAHGDRVRRTAGVFP